MVPRERSDRRRGLAGISPRAVTDQQRYGSVVDELDLHGGAEAPGLRANAASPELLDERLIQWLGAVWSSRRVESRPAAAAGVAEQRELGHDQCLVTSVEERAVHLARLVIEDSQLRHLVGDEARLIETVADGDAKQDDETWADGAHLGTVDSYGCALHALHDSQHCRESTTIVGTSQSPRRGGGSRQTVPLDWRGELLVQLPTKSSSGKEESIVVQKRRLDLVAKVKTKEGEVGEVELDGLRMIQRGEGKVSVYFPTDRGIKYEHVEERKYLAQFLQVENVPTAKS